MQQALEKTLSSRAIPTVLHQDVQHDAMLVNCPPQIVQHAPNADDPGSRWLGRREAVVLAQGIDLAAF